MPLRQELVSQVDQIRDYLYAGGYPNPLSNAEQLSYLFFFNLIEGFDEQNARTQKGYDSFFKGRWKFVNPLNAPDGRKKSIAADRLKWSAWASTLKGEPLVRFLRDEVFAFFGKVGERIGSNFMDGARLEINDPATLSQVIEKVDQLRLSEQDSDTKGDLYEYVLGRIRSAGEIGQFRTPRHIIRAMVQMAAPELGETVFDPACGIAGFLVGAHDHLLLDNSDPETVEEHEREGQTVRVGYGDLLSDAEWKRLRNETFYGQDVDPSMVRLATMNLLLRGLENVRIEKRNTLYSWLTPGQCRELGLPVEYDVVLANPPFSGTVDFDSIASKVRVGTTKATEILFLNVMLQRLKKGADDGKKPGGRCAVIVPEGLLFGSTGAHKEIRRKLIESNTVDGVISLPGGVFNPYAGVKTSILLFRRGGQTERVLFYIV